MPFLSLHHFLILAGTLLLLDSFAQAGVAAVSSSDLSGNFTLPGLHNSSNYGFPPTYIIPNANPRVIIKIQPTTPDPLDYSRVTTLVLYGLNSLVQETIRSHGDNAIPEQGMFYTWLNTAVYVQSHLPGTLDLTYGTTATLLTGIWEIVSLYGANVLHMDVFVGRYDEAHYRGRVALYQIAPSKDSA